MIKLSNNKKPNKKEAFSILVNAKYSDIDSLSSDEIDTLINYFAPPLPKIAKNVEQWVAKAVAKKDIRESLKYLYVKDSIIYGCDGSRVHWGKTAFKDGYYEPKTLLPIDFNGKYPDVNRVIQFDTSDSFSNNLNDSSIIFRSLHCYLLNGTNYQQSFINESVNGNDSIVYTTSKDNDKLRGHSQFGEFVVMGMRKKTK